MESLHTKNSYSLVFYWPGGTLDHQKTDREKWFAHGGPSMASHSRKLKGSGRMKPAENAGRDWNQINWSMAYAKPWVPVVYLFVWYDTLMSV
jgi:hypothetical protein